ncbi:MAG: hypothetical protein WD396_00860 [Pseudohongiellaceae bacterium]
MVAFFSILVAVALLGLTVYGLHRYQTMEVEYTVDRSMPLPPLEADLEIEAGEAKPADRHDSESESRAQASRDKTETETRTRTSAAAKTRNTQPWLAEVNALKSRDQMVAALSRCRQEFPLWGAYNQACIILRTQLKQSQSASAQQDALLEQLYTLAATAEMLHDKSGETPTLNLAQIRQLDLARLDSLTFPYRDIGYAHLRLVRKNDIRLMQARWGRPQQHQLPRTYHREWWQTFSTTDT